MKTSTYDPSSLANLIGIAEPVNSPGTLFTQLGGQ